MRALVRVGLCLVLGSWPAGAWAQAGGDVMEDDSSSAEEEQGSGKQEEEEEDSGDGDSGGGSDEAGIHFGLRLAYGFPMGKVQELPAGSTGSGDLSDGTVGQIPIWLDLGWQFTPAFMLGAYFSYGFVLPSEDTTDDCDRQGVTCRLTDLRLGLQAQLSFSPKQATDPWIGAGVGYEWLTVKAGDYSSTYHGWEMLMLQAGIDFGGDSGGSTFGPFAAFTFGQFSKYSFKTAAGDDSGSIDEKAMHNWLFVGVRGALK